jgi:hypothetical protein
MGQGRTGRQHEGGVVQLCRKKRGVITAPALAIHLSWRKKIDAQVKPAGDAQK